jgi:hypothetical protein
MFSNVECILAPFTQAIVPKDIRYPAFTVKKDLGDRPFSGVRLASLVRERPQETKERDM